jgi:hypothetical protein
MAMSRLNVSPESFMLLSQLTAHEQIFALPGWPAFHEPLATLKPVWQAHIAVWKCNSLCYALHHSTCSMSGRSTVTVVSPLLLCTVTTCHEPYIGTLRHSYVCPRYSSHLEAAKRYCRVTILAPSL